MAEKYGDPIGEAIKAFSTSKKPDDIIVSSDLCEDDIIPVEVLFRRFNEMPDLEKKALDLVRGKVLDIGAGAGAHSLELIKQGYAVEAIDLSQGAVTYMKTKGINARAINFFDLKEEKYDTLLMLMNGIGLAGRLSLLESTLRHAKTLMNPGGRLICDSSDISYLYEDENGSVWIDLNTEYYGNFRFQMTYKKEKGPWFDWLYVDFEHLFKAAKTVGLKARRVYEEDDHYLAELIYE